MTIKKSLYQISQQTGIPRKTLYYRAMKLFNRGVGLFSKEQEMQILQYKDMVNEPDKIMSGETGETIPPAIQTNTIHEHPMFHNIENDLGSHKDRVFAVDRMLGFVFPNYKACPDHLDKLCAFLYKMCQEGVKQENKERASCRRLIDAFNTWSDEYMKDEDESIVRQKQQLLERQWKAFEKKPIQKRVKHVSSNDDF